MNLIDLGWNTFFEEQFEEYGRRGLIAARVALEHRNRYVLYSERGEISAEPSGRMRHEAEERHDLPAVGDWVAVAAHDEGLGTIHALLPRRSSFSRKAAGSRTEEQIVAANVDTVFIVAGLDDNYNPRRIERATLLAWESGATPVLVLNKADLCDDVEAVIAETETVVPGVPVVALSAARDEQLDVLAPWIRPGRTVALIGSSGVGKSSIVNRLVGAAVQEVGDVSGSVGKGKHTTTHRELIVLPGGGLLMDTPGMRELQLWGEGEGLADVFEDVERIAEECRFRDCRHEGEPGCAIGEALADGRLDAGRLANYRKMQRELDWLDRRQDEQAQRAEKQRWKAVTKSMRGREIKRT